MLGIQAEERGRPGRHSPAGRALALGACVLACGATAVPAIAGTFHGGAGSDHLTGTDRSDLVAGHSGDDVLQALAGPDTLRGATGADRLRPGDGADLAKGGAGNDRLNARDGDRDLLDCGPGPEDVAVVDATEDGVYDCEEVIEPEVTEP